MRYGVRVSSPSERRQRRSSAYDGPLLDDIDRRILVELQDDGRVTMAELGRRVNLSAPAVGERVQRLEESGVITGYSAVVDPARDRLPDRGASSASARRGASSTRSPRWRGRRPRWSSAIASPARTATSRSSTCGRWTTSRASSTASPPSARRPRRSCTRRRSRGGRCRCLDAPGGRLRRRHAPVCDDSHVALTPRQQKKRQMVAGRVRRDRRRRPPRHPRGNRSGPGARPDRRDRAPGVGVGDASAA